MAGNVPDNPESPTALAVPGGKTAFVLAVAAGKTMTEACALAGVSTRTGRRYLADPTVKREVRELRALMIGEAVGVTAQNMAKAARSLAELLDSPNPMVKLHASRLMLEAGGRLWERMDLAEQVAEIQAKLGMAEGGGS